jgi:hypothetical protein
LQPDDEDVALLLDAEADRVRAETQALVAALREAKDKDDRAAVRKLRNRLEEQRSRIARLLGIFGQPDEAA